MDLKKTILAALCLLLTARAGASPSGTLSGKVELTNGVRQLYAHRDYASLHRPADEAPPTPSLTEAVVYLEKVPGKYTPPKLNSVFHIEGSRIEPRVSAVLLGRRVVFANNDPYDHVVRSDASRNAAFRCTLKVKGPPCIYRTQAAEEFSVSLEGTLRSECRILVLQNPYFVRPDRKGAFVIRNVPPGTYVLKAWHPDFETVQTKVTVKPSREIAAHLLFEKAR